MANKIEDIEGIGEKTGVTLRASGISTMDALLKTAATKKGRQELAERTALSEKNILKWVNMADLCRIKGVSTQYSELLEGAGIDTVKELAMRNAINLAEEMSDVNESKKLVRQTPSKSIVEGWVEQAKTMSAMVSY